MILLYNTKMGVIRFNELAECILTLKEEISDDK